MLKILIEVLVLVLGLALGMLINYFSDVLPLRRSLVPPFCLHCRQNVTLANYLFLARRCVHCGKPRSIRTWLVEIISAGMTLWLWLYPPQSLGFAVGILLLVFFGVVIVIDVEHHLILNPVSLAGAFIALVVGFWLHGWKSTLLGGIAGYGFMLGVYLLGILFAKFVVRRRGDATDDESIGYGDVSLTGVLGLLLGWDKIALGIFLALLLSFFYGIGYLLVTFIMRRYRAFSAIPFGPFLVGGAFIVLYLRDMILASISK